MYKEVEKNLNFVDREKKILKFWKENQIFEKSIEEKEGFPVYTFYDGPPTANGKPHIGHVETRVFKDMIPRYKTMKGHKVIRKAGWDTHGLPVELEVEKLLGLDGKDQIEEYGLQPFIEKCKESVWTYKEMWEEFSDTVGYWVNIDDPYITYSNDYIESEWWALKEIWKKGLLYKGHKIVPYCPRCGTPLSSHEVAQGYKDVKDTSAIVRFKVKHEDAYILAWTTTPWTLPSNVALCVNPNETYVKVKQGSYTYYMAEALLENVLKEDYEVIDSFVGTSLEYKEYEPLFPLLDSKKKAYYVTCADYVTLSDGTGVVHIAPAFGEDDAEVGRKYDLPFLQLVNDKGEMNDETPWPNTFVKDADPLILKDLKDRGLLFAALPFEHNYPHCWRCDTPLIYYAKESWFIKMTSVKEDLIRNNNTVNWLPESIGKGRFGDWLENVQDWGISRNRYWGTPLNVWECECGYEHAVGSIEELKSMSTNCPDDIELHRPMIDDVTIICPECKKEMQRVEEVIDCWFDSGAMPFAQWHYPFENKDVFEENFPADFISEAVDQTRGWFYSLLAISTILFNKAPYKNVIVLGHVQDENGQKMSKSRGNAVDPFEALESYGADAIRWYFYENSAPWLTKRWHKDSVIEGQRKFMGTLWNTYVFFVLYANIDTFDATKYKLDFDNLPAMDKWILSKLNTLIALADENLENFKILETARAMQVFVDEMSNWYVRRCRERYWVSGMPQDKINAYLTLHTVLVTFVKLAAPMIPFMSEEIYQNLVKSIDESAPISVHLCDYPVSNPNYINKELERDMDLVKDIVVLGRSIRNTSNTKNRQPLNKMYVKADADLSKDYLDIIKDELNIKKIMFTKDVSSFTEYNFKPQLKTLGPKYGKQLNEIRTALASMNGTKAKNELDTQGLFTLQLKTSTIELKEEDVLIETAQKEGFASMNEGNLTVVLDIHLTDDLIEEGFVREIISKIQNMRKEEDFNITDRITIYVDGNEKISSIMKRNEKEIMQEVLGKEIVYGSLAKASKEWNINQEKVTLGVEN